MVEEKLICMLSLYGVPAEDPGRHTIGVYLFGGKIMRLLLCEDEHEMSAAVEAVLLRSNYSVDCVFDGQDALDYIETGLYDGVILDIMMPKMDGITVLKKARAKGIDVPVLLLTAKSQVDDRVEGLDAGADDYLTKPFAMKELVARVRSITRREGARLWRHQARPLFLRPFLRRE